jgi:hypothetical protein
LRYARRDKERRDREGEKPNARWYAQHLRIGFREEDVRGKGGRATERSRFFPPSTDFIHSTVRKAARPTASSDASN